MRSKHSPIFNKLLLIMPLLHHHFFVAGHFKLQGFAKLTLKKIVLKEHTSKDITFFFKDA